MKTLVNKANPAIRITAPEITIAHPPISNEGYVYWIPAISEMYNPIDWTLVEEEPACKESLQAEEETIVETIKEFIKKGERCEQQAVEDNDQENYIFWGGFRNCAENILREVEEPAEGIKGNLEEVPSNVDLEKEIQRYLCEECSSDDEPTIKEIAHHFYKLGFNARKEVANDNT